LTIEEFLKLIAAKLSLFLTCCSILLWFVFRHLYRVRHAYIMLRKHKKSSSIVNKLINRESLEPSVVFDKIINDLNSFRKIIKNSENFEYRDELHKPILKINDEPRIDKIDNLDLNLINGILFV
jgi:hypothetical protein